MSKEFEEKNNSDRIIKNFEITPLPRFEFLFHLVIWFVFFFTGCYEVHRLIYNKETIQHLKTIGFIEKTYFGLYKSHAEYLWNSILTLFSSGWRSFLFYIIVSWILRIKTTPKIFMFGCVALSISLNYYHSSKEIVAIEMVIFLIPAIAGFFRSKTIIWIFGVVVLQNLTRISDIAFFQQEYIFSSVFSYMAMLITRGIAVGLTISSCHERSWKLMLEMCFYFWYFPSIIGCRMMTVKNFIAEVYEPLIIADMKIWVRDIFKVFAYFCLWNFVTCLIPVNLVFITYDVTHFSQIGVIGALLCHGVNFYMAYFVLYKTVFLVTKFDGFLTTDGPECISHIVLYSRMWRNFDRGFYVWLKDNIFLPIVRRSPMSIAKHIAILLCYIFACVFHKVQTNNVLWILINIFQLYAENLLKYTYNFGCLGPFLEKHFSQLNLRRIIGFAGGLSFLVSIYSFGLFELGLSITNNLYFNDFKWDSNCLYYRVFLLLLFAYSHSQVSLTANNYLQQRLKR